MPLLRMMCFMADSESSERVDRCRGSVCTWKVGESCALDGPPRRRRCRSAHPAGRLGDKWGAQRPACGRRMVLTVLTVTTADRPSGSDQGFRSTLMARRSSMAL